MRHRLGPGRATAWQRAKAGVQRQRVRNAFEGLQRLRDGVTLELPLRQVIEAGRD